ncbi:unnamed protein product, partial [Gulo gulo]
MNQCSTTGLLTVSSVHEICWAETEGASCHRPQLRPENAHPACSPRTPLSGRPLFA